MVFSLLGYRQRFVIASAFLTGLLGAGFLIEDFSLRLWYLVVLLISSLVVYGLMFRRNLHLIGLWLGVVLPFYLLGGSLLFEMLLPSYWWMRLMFLGLVMVMIYANFLASNIFLVSMQRTIKLYQAALGVSLFLVIAVVFLVMDALLAFRFMPWINMILTFLLILPVSVYLIWMVDLSAGLRKKYLYYGLILALLVGEGSLVMSFWPTPITIKAIFIASLVYGLGGLFQAHFLEKVFKQTEQEFWWLLAAVFVSVLLVTRWG
ncbi:MAG: hypothetical protein GXP43_00180 [bacterium]|nr:hypothetical protein [bacterium]